MQKQKSCHSVFPLSWVSVHIFDSALITCQDKSCFYSQPFLYPTIKEGVLSMVKPSHYSLTVEVSLLTISLVMLFLYTNLTWDQCFAWPVFVSVRRMSDRCCWPCTESSCLSLSCKVGIADLPGRCSTGLPLQHPPPPLL